MESFSNKTFIKNKRKPNETNCNLLQLLSSSLFYYQLFACVVSLSLCLSLSFSASLSYSFTHTVSFFALAVDLLSSFVANFK